MGALLVLGGDQWSKWEFPNIVLNSGVSFGAFPWSFLLVLGLRLVVFVSLVLWAWWSGMFSQQGRAREVCALGVVLGGGLSNILDSVVFGAVRDIWRIPGTSIYNNFADWALFFGMLAILAGWIQHQRQQMNSAVTP